MLVSTIFHVLFFKSDYTFGTTLEDKMKFIKKKFISIKAKFKRWRKGLLMKNLKCWIPLVGVTLSIDGGLFQPIKDEVQKQTADFVIGLNSKYKKEFGTLFDCQYHIS